MSNVNFATFAINDFNEFRIKMLNWCKQFNIFCLLDNRQYNFDEAAFECLLAVGCKQMIAANAGNAFASLKEFYANNKSEWIFGHLAYDLKNETEQLSSSNFDGIGFNDCCFFVPEIIISLNNTHVEISTDNASQIFSEINSSVVRRPSSVVAPSITINSRIDKEDYLSTIKKLQQHILRGDCYELNFCQEFYAQPVQIDPVQVYEKLTDISPNPFSALYKVEDKYCICASPERYLKNTGGKIISQPIKGTSKRDLANRKQDKLNKEYLLANEKEKSENVMVVDLVRNDLSKICKEGSVKVDELFGIYSFPQVHQMISTISGEMQDGLDWIDAVKATFPMGSMTGAPKKRVMELVEKYEHTRRGLFSGAIGYINPDGDFDFNVVIRSILYNASTAYLSFQAGSAITFYSDAENEYAECLLKAEAIKQVLQ